MIFFMAQYIFGGYMSPVLAFECFKCICATFVQTRLVHGYMLVCLCQDPTPGKATYVRLAQGGGGEADQGGWRWGEDEPLGR